MARHWLMFLVLCMVPCSALAQCSIGASPRNADILSYVTGGHGGYGAAVVAIGAQCPGNLSPNVKFKLSRSSDLFVVSPSTGTTPVFPVVIAVNPNTVGKGFPGTGPIEVDFTTVDQSPPSTARVTLRVTIVGLDPPVIESVVNAASLDPVITPGGIVSILGTNLGPNMSATFDQGGLYPNTLGNTIVTFNGIQAPLLSTSQSQINAVAPYGIAGQKEVQVVVTHYPQTSLEQVSDAFSVAEIDNSVAIFATAPRGNGPSGIANCDAQGCTPNSAANPAPPGSVIVLYATVGPILTNFRLDGSLSALAQLYAAEPVSLTVGGQPATLRYFGTAPFQVWGIFQVNALVPNDIASGPQPVVLTIGQTSSASQQAMVFVR